MADEYKFPVRLRLAMRQAATVLTNLSDDRRRDLDKDDIALMRKALSEIDMARAAGAPAETAADSQAMRTLQKSLDGWKEEVEQRSKDYRKARDQLDLQALHQKSDVWYWQGDGSDYPESISNSMAVVMRGDQLRELLAAGAPAETAKAVELIGVAHQIKRGAGFWHSCSGCHDTEDGHPVGNYAYSNEMQCALGNGCSECGGLGACWDNNDYSEAAGDFLDAAPQIDATTAPARPELAVLYCSMPESNGKSNWTATLTRKGDTGFDAWGNGYTFSRSEYPDRVRYEADCMRFLIGEIADEPFILDYDDKKHSGYVAPATAPDVAKDAVRLDFIEKNSRCDPKMDGNNVWWPTAHKHALRGPTLRAAIDAAMGALPPTGSEKGGA